MCGVEPHDVGQIAGRFGADDLTMKAVTHEHWQVATVVEMSVAQNDGIYLPGGTGKGAQLRNRNALNP